MPAAEPTERERMIFEGKLRLVSSSTMKKWREGLWRPGPPPPLRRTRWGMRAVRVGEAKKPGPLLTEVEGAVRGAGRRSRSAPGGKRRIAMADRSVALVVTLERDTEELYARGYRSLQQFCLEKRNASVTQLADRHPREFNAVFSE